MHMHFVISHALNLRYLTVAGQVGTAPAPEEGGRAESSPPISAAGRHFRLD